MARMFDTRRSNHRAEAASRPDTFQPCRRCKRDCVRKRGVCTQRLRAARYRKKRKDHRHGERDGGPERIPRRARPDQARRPVLDGEGRIVALNRAIQEDEFDDLGKIGSLQNGWAGYVGI